MENIGDMDSRSKHGRWSVDRDNLIEILGNSIEIVRPKSATYSTVSIGICACRSIGLVKPQKKSQSVTRILNIYYFQIEK